MSRNAPSRKLNSRPYYGKTRERVSCSVLRKVAAPWGRGDLSAVASAYSISGFALALKIINT
jgi:hypothetical protein